MARLGYLQITRNCNQSCRFCSNPENGREIPLLEAIKRIQSFNSESYDGIILTGGEPTLHPELPEMIEACREIGLPCRLITNGQRTADPVYLGRLIEAGLEHLHISIHTHKAALQAELTGNRDSLANIARSLHHCGKTALTVDINQTLCSSNADHIEQTIRWICERFDYIRHISWTLLDARHTRVAKHPELIPRLSDIEKPLLAAMTFLDNSGRSFRIDQLPLCFLGNYCHCQTEVRAIVLGEMRWIDFLDERGGLPTEHWFYGMGLQCRKCRLVSICAGLRDIDRSYSSDELRPSDIDPQKVIDKIRT